MIVAGAGNDTVDYWGTEVSIDGGTGNNTLIVRSVSGLSSVNLAAAAGTDITGGDSVIGEELPEPGFQRGRQRR